jgi:membrane-bound serine protease (ClpP class)
VLEAVSLSAQEALRLNVIDLVADNVAQLPERLDGRKLEVLGLETLPDAGRIADLMAQG